MNTYVISYHFTNERGEYMGYEGTYYGNSRSEAVADMREGCALPVTVTSVRKVAEQDYFPYV